MCSSVCARDAASAMETAVVGLAAPPRGEPSARSRSMQVLAEFTMAVLGRALVEGTGFTECGLVCGVSFAGGCHSQALPSRVTDWRHAV